MATERNYRKLQKTQKKVKRRVAREMKNYVNTIASLIVDTLPEDFGTPEIQQTSIRLKQFEAFPTAQQDLINATLFFNTFLVDYLLENEETMVIGGVDQVSNAIDYDISFDIVNDMAFKYINFRRTFLKDTVLNTNTNAILDIISRALAEGTSPQEVGALIRASSVEGAFSAARAEMIAVNEMGNAFEFGRWSTVQDFRINTGDEIQKTWDTVGDNKVTQQCMDNMAAGWIPFIADFPSGDQTAPRASNPRCRCTVNYRREGALDL